MRIGIDLENGAFEQDVRELLMAFYPGAEFIDKEQNPGIAADKGQNSGIAADKGQNAEIAADKGQNSEVLADEGMVPGEKQGSADAGCGEAFKDVDRIVKGQFLNEGENVPCRYALSVQKTGKEAGNREIDLSKLSPVIRRGLEEAEKNLPFVIDREDRKETKNRIKRRLYFLLMLDTGKELPWGALTGIRPVKIPEGKLSEGWSDEKILDFMEEHYLVGEKKRKLSLEIAKEERALLAGMEVEKGYSLYIGIPFCPTTCLYCSFTSYPIGKWMKHLEAYLEGLRRELLLVKEWAGADKGLQTIYIGGGTPTSLPEDVLRMLMEMVNRIFAVDAVKEFTVEAGRPDSLSREKLRILKEYGVQRISINPQSMNQRTLDLIGRRHSVEQVKEMFAAAREEGFTNINMDIILGLPGEQEAEIRHTLAEIKALKPDCLTVHCLALKRAARLNLEKEQYAGYPMASGEMIDRLVDLAAHEAEEMGMKPYYLYRQKNMAGNLENVGYAAPGKACLYNITMMEERHSVIACGAGSTSKRIYPDGRLERCENVKEVAVYLDKIEEMIARKQKLFGAG